MRPPLAIAAQDHPIHVLLTDIQVPVLPGPELTAALREKRPHLAVLYISGSPVDDSRVTNALEQPCTRFLQKPLQIDDAFGSIAELLAEVGQSGGPHPP
jgi:two-component system cell cycle sensor histidine kinase/response regulator CckA